MRDNPRTDWLEWPDRLCGFACPGSVAAVGTPESETTLMPTYEYECTNCGRIVEIMQPITARPKRKPDEPCEGCGQRAPIRRLIGTGGAVLFKGSGFYETDYRSDSYKKAAKAEQDAKSGGDKKDGGSKDKAKKSEGKPQSEGSTTKSKTSKPKPSSDGSG